MIIEEKLAAFIKAQQALYVAHPLMVETVFYDQSQTGFPTATAPELFVDTLKDWLLDEYAGGVLRWAGRSFPIVSNTAQHLAVTGDPSAVANVAGLPYQIVPPSAAGLTHFLQHKPFEVLTAFAQVPTAMPCITIRLEKDEQAETYVGESLEQYAVDGVEFDVRSQAMQGHYLLSIWTVNRESTLWTYAWLQNAMLRSMAQFATWGLYDIGLSGSDLDPQLQYLAEKAYARHLLFTATRVERAVTLRPAEWVSELCLQVCAQYARFDVTVPGLE